MKTLILILLATTLHSNELSFGVDSGFQSYDAKTTESQSLRGEGYASVLTSHGWQNVTMNTRHISKDNAFFGVHASYDVLPSLTLGLGYRTQDLGTQNIKATGYAVWTNGIIEDTMHGNLDNVYLSARYNFKLTDNQFLTLNGEYGLANYSSTHYVTYSRRGMNTVSVTDPTQVWTTNVEMETDENYNGAGTHSAIMLGYKANLNSHISLNLTGGIKDDEITKVTRGAIFPTTTNPASNETPGSTVLDAANHPSTYSFSGYVFQFSINLYI